MSRSLSSYTNKLIDPYIHDDERVYGIGITRYIRDNKRIINFTNYNSKDENLTIRIISSSAPEIFIPETGEMFIVNGSKEDKRYKFSFNIPKNRAYFVVCSL